MRVHQVRVLTGCKQEQKCTSNTLFFFHTFLVSCVFIQLSDDRAEMDDIQVQITSKIL